MKYQLGQFISMPTKRKERNITKRHAAGTDQAEKRLFDLYADALDRIAAPQG